MDQKDHQKHGIVSDIINANKKALEEMPEEKFDMMDGLEEIAEEKAQQNEKPEDQEMDSDFAPVSPFADMPSREEEKKMEEDKRKKEFLSAVNIVSSASETEESGAEGRAKKEHKLAQMKGGKQSSKEKSSPSKKVKFYMGQRVLSDTEDMGYGSSTNNKNVNKQTHRPTDKAVRDPDESSSDRSSHGSADEYFN